VEGGINQHDDHPAQAMNLARGLAVVLGWLIVSLRPGTDLLYKHLRSEQLGKLYVNSDWMSFNESYTGCIWWSI
jgi:hypothetical protein